MEEERSYKEDCKVNRFKLEIAAEEQSTIYQYWCEIEYETKIDVETAENFVKVTEAEVDMEIREKALANKGVLENGVKATADAIKSAVILDSRVRKAKRDVVRKKEQYKNARSAKNGMEHRKSAIESLLKMWTSGYYSDPNRPRTLSNDLANEARSKLNNKSGD